MDVEFLAPDPEFIVLAETCACRNRLCLRALELGERREHAGSLYDLYRARRVVRDVEDHSAYYRTEQLAELRCVLKSMR